MGMILSSADILRVLGGSEIIRLSASVKIVDGKPSLSGVEGLFIYINRFPVVSEFQATWTIYIESDGSEPDDLVLIEIKKLLPSIQVKQGLMTVVTTTDFLSENTQTAPEAPKQAQAKVDLTQYEERFQSLVEDVQDQMLLVTSGRPGKDGKDGRDGVDGRDGRDVDGTALTLEELANVDQGIPKEKGQVLTWDGTEWTNLFIPQLLSVTSGGGGGGGGASALNDLIDVDAPTPNNGDIIAYNSASGLWETTAAPPADISGNSINDLNDVDTGTVAPAPDQALVWDGSNWVPGDVASDAPVDSVNGQTGVVVLTADDVGALESGDNVSELVNDAGYITLAEVPESGIPEAPQDGNYYVRQNGAWVNLADALTALNDRTIDGGDFITGSSAGDTEVVDGGNFS